MSAPTFVLSGPVLGTPDVAWLLHFYRDLLAGEVLVERDDWGVLATEGGRLSFQLEPDHVRPMWPAGAGDQQMQAHLDIRVDDLEGGVERAVALGAVVAEHQPQDDVRVLLDPAGHPFCLFVPHH